MGTLALHRLSVVGVGARRKSEDPKDRRPKLNYTPIQEHHVVFLGMVFLPHEVHGIPAPTAVLAPSLKKDRVLGF